MSCKANSEPPVTQGLKRFKRYGEVGATPTQFIRSHSSTDRAARFEREGCRCDSYWEYLIQVGGLMHDAALEEFKQLLDDVSSGKLPESAIPRLFYMGHRMVYSLDTPRGWAHWECVSCKHQWEAWDGTTCPACKAVKN